MISLSHPFDAVIFDMDGTLLDTEAAFKAVAYEVCTELGFEMTDLIHAGMVGSSHEATARLLTGAFGAGFSHAVFQEKCRAAMRVRMAEAVPIKPGAAELVAALRELDIPMAVATSSHATHAVPHLTTAGVISYFDAIVTREDVTNPKPHPEPYLMAAERLRVAPAHCIAFEDSHLGVRAAHAAGMRTVMVPDLVHPTEEIAALCVAVLESLAHAHEPMISAPRVLRAERDDANGSQRHLQVKSKG